MSVEQSVSLPHQGSPAAPDAPPVRVLLVLGPHRASADQGVVGAGEHSDLTPLHATVRVVSTRTEQETVGALAIPCDAIVLDPGSLESFSGRLVDAIDRLGVPVIIVRGRAEASGQAPSALLVTAAATASITGGGAAAYDAAVEAAACFAWECRLDVAGGDVVPTQRIAPVE